MSDEILISAISETLLLAPGFTAVLALLPPWQAPQPTNVRRGTGAYTGFLLFFPAPGRGAMFASELCDGGYYSRPRASAAYSRTQKTAAGSFRCGFLA